MSDHQIGSSSAPSAPPSHARDLRFAGAISAGLIAAILVGGALLAPVADWNGLTSSRQSGGESGTVTLAQPRSTRVSDGGTPAERTTRTAAERGLGSLGLVVATPGDLGFEISLPGGGTAPGGGPLFPGVSPGGGGGGDDDNDGSGPGTSRTGAAGGSGGDVDDPSSPNFNPDTDGDGIPDQRFAAYGIEPTDPAATTTATDLRTRTSSDRTTPTDQMTNGRKDANTDSDGDGVRNDIEAKAGTRSQRTRTRRARHGQGRHHGRRRAATSAPIRS